MKHTLIAILTLAVIHVSAYAANKQQIEVDIKGMTCKFCAYGVQKKLNKLPNIEKAEVNIDTKKATIVVKEGMQINLDEVKKAIKSSGFVPVKVTTKTIK